MEDVHLVVTYRSLRNEGGGKYSEARRAVETLKAKGAKPGPSAEHIWDYTGLYWRVSDPISGRLHYFRAPGWEY
jgi:hypothetical protein